MIAGKGRLAAQTTARVFRLLNLCGLPTHYLSGGEDDDDNEMLVRALQHDSARGRRRAASRPGSFVKRNPGIARGALLVPRMVEFFLQGRRQPRSADRARPDRRAAASQRRKNSASMSELARMTFEILAHAWRRRDVLLVDLKIEFGRLAGGENQGQLVIADVIDNDSWRIWPQGREELMLDKQMYRNLQTVDDDALATRQARLRAASPRSSARFR